MGEKWEKIGIAFRNEDLEAYLSVPSNGNGSGTAGFSLDDALRALREKGIAEGIMNDELQKIFRECLFDREVLVSRGTPPVDGENGRIEYYFKTKHEYEPKEDKEGRIDYHNVSFLANVKKGQKLCRRIPPTVGKSGRSLRGKEIKGRPGQDAVLPRGPNTGLSPDAGPDILIASLDGCATLNKTKLVEVNPNLDIKGDVDFSTGNIDFNGSLQIGGDVKSGFKVEVTGDLEISGSVEDAEISAGGNALIKSGFIGHNNGLIRTTGDLTLKFAQNQKIRCDGNLILGGELMYCDARVGGNVTAGGRKSAIIGGHVMVEGSVEVPQIGSESYSTTLIEAGCDFKLAERKIEIHQELSLIDTNREKLKVALYNLSRLKLKHNGNLPPEQAKLFERLQDTINYYPAYQEKLTKELEEVGRKLDERRDVYIRVSGTLFPGSKLVIGKFPKVFNEQIEHKTFREIKGEIVESA